MKLSFLKILRPRISWLKWIVFIFLAGTVVLESTGSFQSFQDRLDTETLSFVLGDYRISLYAFIRSLLIVTLVFWTAHLFTDLVSERITRLSMVRATNRELLKKIFQITIYLIAFFVTLDFLGIDLTTLTVLGGALGIGLGFGLQKIASNFISGLILLLEKSIEQDDLVDVGNGAIGFVRKASARFTLVETFDGREIMIPNEDFITNRVTNWTYSSPHGRVEIPIGVAYGSDLELVMEILLEAATEHPDCVETPEPACYLREFGDSSVNFILHFWIGDVTKGRWRPQSEVMMSIWRKFKEQGVEIPFPQRDLHLKSPEIIKLMNHEK